MRTLYGIVAALLIALLALSACVPTVQESEPPANEYEAPGGGEAVDDTDDEEDTDDQKDANDEEEGANVVEVTLTSYEIEMPATLQSGTITFEVENESEDEEHSMEIEGNGIEVELEPHLQPGEEGTLTVELPPGTYTVYCPVEDHRDEHDMEIQITVE